MYVLGSELWEENFEDTLRLVKVDVWEVRKQKLYGEDACPSHHRCQTWLEMQGLSQGVEGSGLVRWVSCRIRVGWVCFMYTVVMCMLVIVAPPIVVGA